MRISLPAWTDCAAASVDASNAHAAAKARICIGVRGDQSIEMLPDPRDISTRGPPPRTVPRAWFRRDDMAVASSG